MIGVQATSLCRGGGIVSFRVAVCDSDVVLVVRIHVLLDRCRCCFVVVVAVVVPVVVGSVVVWYCGTVVKVTLLTTDIPDPKRRRRPCLHFYSAPIDRLSVG